MRFLEIPIHSWSARSSFFQTDAFWKGIEGAAPQNRPLGGEGAQAPPTLMTILLTLYLKGCFFFGKILVLSHQMFDYKLNELNMNSL